jgi:hypothetical protein
VQNAASAANTDEAARGLVDMDTNTVLVASRTAAHAAELAAAAAKEAAASAAGASRGPCA